MSAPAPVPVVAQVVFGTIWRMQSRAEWLHGVADPYERAWLLTRAVCEALHAEGIERAPSARALDECLRRRHRDEDIVADFNGRNYADLARKHHISTRTVRRIIERARRGHE